jgi:hypothetical protein
LPENEALMTLVKIADVVLGNDPFAVGEYHVHEENLYQISLPNVRTFLGVIIGPVNVYMKLLLCNHNGQRAGTRQHIHHNVIPGSTGESIDPLFQNRGDGDIITKQKSALCSR